eukprot:3869394-Rhodomonas_salina.1
MEEQWGAEDDRPSAEYICHDICDGILRKEAPPAIAAILNPPIAFETKPTKDAAIARTLSPTNDETLIFHFLTSYGKAVGSSSVILRPAINQRTAYSKLRDSSSYSVAELKAARSTGCGCLGSSCSSRCGGGGGDDDMLVKATNQASEMPARRRCPFVKLVPVPGVSAESGKPLPRVRGRSGDFQLSPYAVAGTQLG